MLIISSTRILSFIEIFSHVKYNQIEVRNEKSTEFNQLIFDHIFNVLTAQPYNNQKQPDLIIELLNEGCRQITAECKTPGEQNIIRQSITEIEKIEDNKNISANEKIVDKNEIQIKESSIEIKENIKNKEDNDIKTEDKEQSINKEKKETNQENKTDENINGDENKNHEIKQIEASKTIINETEINEIKEKVNEIKNEIEVSQKLINENKKEIKEKEKNTSSPKKEEKSFRPHYVFYYKPYKRVGGSDSNNVSSMTYFNGQGKDRPNYQFYCSYGSSKSSSINQKTNNNKEKEINNSPIGIASTSKISQKNKSYIPFSRTETKNSKTVNIFKPVPKTIVPAKKYIDKFQENNHNH